MDRRDFLGLMVAQQVAQRTESPLHFIGKKAGIHPFRTRPTGKRPNVFVISVDMVSPDHHHHSRTMHREMNLPSIRSIMSDGVVFNNAFCASPLCAPARAALATGRYTYITANGERAHDGIETILRPTDVIFQEYLKATGYTTKHAGKGHLGTQKFMDAFDENDNAWDRWAPPIQDDEQYLAYLRRLGIKRQRYKREIVGLQPDRKSPGNSLGGWIEQSDGKPFPIEGQYSYFLAQHAIEKLDAALEEKNPIYLQLDFFDPHQPFSIPAGFEARERELRRVTAELPASYEKVRARDWKPNPDEPKIYNFYQKYWGLYNPDTLREYRLGNALQMEMVDRAIGHFLDALKKRGLYDDAIIVFTSDHGEMNGHRSLIDKGVYLYPEVLRVPYAIKMPHGKHRTIDAPVCHMDVAPTLLEVAGVEPEERLDGRSLLPMLNGGAEFGDRELLFECGWHVGINYACATQRWERGGRHHLYTYNCSSTVDELYDLNEVDGPNRNGDTKLHKEMVERLGALVSRDPRWLGYWHSFRLDHYFDLPKGAGGDFQMFKPV